jgi:hypothetical protein
MPGFRGPSDGNYKPSPVSCPFVTTVLQSNLTLLGEDAATVARNTACTPSSGHHISQATVT